MPFAQLPVMLLPYQAWNWFSLISYCDQSASPLMVRLSLGCQPSAAGRGAAILHDRLHFRDQAPGGVVRSTVAVQVAGIATGVVYVFQPKVRASGKPFFSRWTLAASEMAKSSVMWLT